MRDNSCYLKVILRGNYLKRVHIPNKFRSNENIICAKQTCLLSKACSKERTYRCSDEWHHNIRSIIGRCPVIFDIQLVIINLCACLCNQQRYYKLLTSSLSVFTLILLTTSISFSFFKMVLVEKLDVFYKNYVKSWETSGDDLKLGSSSKEAETWPTRI